MHNPAITTVRNRLTRDKWPHFNSFLDKWDAFHDTHQLSTEHQSKAVLFHYTSAIGLLGILKSHSLWLTHSSFLNDSEEFSYLNKIITELGDKLPQPRNRSEHLSSAQSVNQIYNLISAFKNWGLFVGCLSTKGNDLSQWRGYASGGTGYCLGFDAKDIITALNHTQTDSIAKKSYLRKVIYSRYEQERWLKVSFDAIFADAHQITTDIITKANGQHVDISTTETIQYMDAAMRLTLIEFGSCFKHPDFEAESEWRIAHLKLAQHIFPTNDMLRGNPLGNNVEFRSSGNTIVPYLPIYLGLESTRGGRSIPVKEIMIGPINNREVSKASVEMLILRYFGYYAYKTPSIAVSEISLR